MILLALILNTIGFLCLAASGKRYRETLLGRRRFPRSHWVKAVGAVLIAASWFSLSCPAGFGSASVMFAGISTVGAAISIFSVTVRRHPGSR